MTRRDLLLASASPLVLMGAKRHPPPPPPPPPPPTGGTTYYLDPAGDDSHNGTSPSTAWKTPTKVNGHTYGAGDSVLSLAGAIFTTGINLTAANWSTVNPPTPTNPVYFGNYGTASPGYAEFNVGTGIGFHSSNIGCFTVDTLAFVGNGTTNAVDGVLIENSLTGNVTLEAINLQGLGIAGFGKNGINVQGSHGLSGFDNITINNFEISNCTFKTGSIAGTCGVFVQSILQGGALGAGYGHGATTPAHTNLVISNGYVHDCPGLDTSGNSALSSSGNGIGVGETGTFSIFNCAIGNCGSSSKCASGVGGSVGIITIDCIGGTIYDTEVYGQQDLGFQDGDGIDIDGGSDNVTVEYCYTHGNSGAGIIVNSYNDGFVSANTNTTVRYNTSQDDSAAGTGRASAAGSIGVFIDQTTATTSGVAIYNNTIYQSNYDNGAGITLSYTGPATGRINNNIFYVATALGSVPCVYSPFDASGLAFDGNDYYFTAGNYHAYWNGTTYNTLAAWKTATGKEGVNGGFNSDPKLTSPGGGGTYNGPPNALTAYDLQSGSPMRGVGLNLNSLYGYNVGTRDFGGTSIPNGGGTGYNIGCDGS